MAEKALPAAQYEPRDVGGSFIWAGATLVLATVVALAFLPLPLYPAPRLQPSPRADMARFYAEEMQWLNSTGWVDKAHAIVHIPISDAMREVAKAGIPGWPTVTPGAPP
jgi:hypothetical protein